MHGRNRVVLTILLLGICLVSARAAEAINVFPDIMFDNDGAIIYNATTKLFTLNATDIQIKYQDGTMDNMHPTSGGVAIGKVPLTLQAQIDNSGNFISGVTGFDMTEVIATEMGGFQFGFQDLNGVRHDGSSDWQEHDILLAGEIVAFSSSGVVPGGKPIFEFTIDPDINASKFIIQNIFPSIPISVLVQPDDILGTTESWATGFDLVKAKGDKFPTPEPNSILLLGLGLLCLTGAGVTTRRKRKI